ncbi:Zinc transporter ZIP2 [Strongyloides ratti]|uniref:Zinc transporter ZIP2 n=1 Tax=Strongyloides ratti TaxID=34506 RepID=A0A090LDL0_STRRB|nr:Zinc transporter ZIP2 [Strongyloides ratti]CEF66188.1 Zinc transporter ZIP2 [Strongyloides ratti]
MNNLLLQSILGLLILFVTIISALAPHTLIKKFKLDNDGKPNLFLSLMCCVGGGVFLATCFLDILPEIQFGYEDIKKRTNTTNNFPFPQLMVCLGFFFVYLLEELCSKYFHKDDESCNHALPNYNSVETSKPLIHENEENRTVIKVQTTSTEIPCSETTTIDSPKHDEKKPNDYFKALSFAIIMSFHSILEGVALGTKNDLSGTLVLFTSLSLHKIIEAFAVGLQISKTISGRSKWAVLILFIYAIMTPIGALLGAGLKELNINAISRDIAVLILECLAAGTFIYVTFLEIIAQECVPKNNRMYKLGAVFSGFLIIVALQYHNHFF